ncbi:unnamed protein product [Linum trigynum]|uniref:Uncharacterized protein n=1 Tax=Linum trigynum TaxID=586398 RepID=A0AAV2EQ05_9ROSI
MKQPRAKSNMQPNKDLKSRNEEQTLQDLSKRYLHISLDDFKKSDGHVSDTATEDIADDTGGIESRRVHLDLPGIAILLSLLPPHNPLHHNFLLLLVLAAFSKFLSWRVDLEAP